MTRNKRIQFMALSIVEGVMILGRSSDKFQKKTHRSFGRIKSRCLAMKEKLGPVESATDNRDILKKYEKCQAVLDKYAVDGQIDVVQHVNAITIMVNKMQDNIPCDDTRREWATLEGMLFTMFTHLEERGYVESVAVSDQMGEEITWAVMA